VKKRKARVLEKGDLRIINLEWLNREIISSIWEKVALGILRIGLFHIYMARWVEVGRPVE